MERLLHYLILPLLLLSSQAHAEGDQVNPETAFTISPSFGTAVVSNIDGYEPSSYLRADASYWATQHFGFNMFAVSYSEFEMDSGPNANAVSVSLGGVGFGITGKLPLHQHFEPYLRVESFSWNVEARETNLDMKIDEEHKRSLGFAVGARFPFRNILAFKVEALRYNDVSGADINQFGVGGSLQLF